MHLYCHLISNQDVLFSGLACDYGTSPPSLLLYPSEPCWQGHTPVTIVGIIVVVGFSTLSFFSGLTYYEHDPNIPKAYLYSSLHHLYLVIDFSYMQPPSKSIRIYCFVYQDSTFIFSYSQSHLILTSLSSDFNCCDGFPAAWSGSICCGFFLCFFVFVCCLCHYTSFLQTQD